VDNGAHALTGNALTNDVIVGHAGSIPLENSL
jgi:hypothetical protein